MSTHLVRVFMINILLSNLRLNKTKVKILKFFFKGKMINVKYLLNINQHLVVKHNEIFMLVK